MAESRQPHKQPIWLKKRRARGQKPREEVVDSMRRVAKDNKGLIPLLRTSSSVSKSSLLTPMIQDGLVTIRSNIIKRDVVALDCEMVGVGVKGSRSVLGRCSIVGYDGNVVYDSYVRPCEPITDFRTIFSGIYPSHMENAKPFEEASKKIKTILADKIIVGHDLKHDFNAINMTNHPQTLIRDTSHLDILQLGRMPSLKLLAKVCLNHDIQEGSHCSVIDARVCMSIYKLVEDSWEKSLTHVKYSKCFGSLILPSPTGSSPIRTDDICKRSQPSSTSGFSKDPFSSCSSSSSSSSSRVKTHLENKFVSKDFLQNIVSIHCDLVTMTSGEKQVAHCAILGKTARVLFNKHIRPDGEVKDYDLEYTGLRTEEVQCSYKLTLYLREIRKILAGKTVVGYKLSDQFTALGLPLSEYTYRDTAESLLVRRKVNLPLDHIPSLSDLTSQTLHHQHFKNKVLKKAHTSFVIYEMFAKEWEQGLQHN